jgi:RNA polymerase sigma-70 factor (ECF subfamily)
VDQSELKSIQACQAGEMESFVLLYDRYVEKIYRFLYFRTLQKEVAEDITSQVFLKAMDKIKSFNADKGTFQAWLYQIARNLLIDEYRRKKPTDNIDAHYDIADNTDLETETQTKFSNEALQKLLQELPEESQELVTMRLWDELTYSEIAMVTGKTEGSLKMQFSRIIGKLQQHAHLLVLSLIFTRW